MKKSTRYLRGTLVTLSASIFVYTSLSRIYGRDAEPYVPARANAEELAALDDFTRIDLRGDFQVEIVREDGYAIDYFPLGPERGELRARQEDGTLFIEGFGNRGEEGGESGRLRIAMPALEEADLNFAPAISISGFSGERLELNILSVETLGVSNNDFTEFRAAARGRGLLRLEDNEFAGSRFDLTGQYRLEIGDGGP